ncbi:MAG: SspB family protein [Alphaproteobacteria bacterium]
MAGNELRYDSMVEEALRGVVGKALTHVVKHGLPGEHHFYITFRTDDPGVVVSDNLRQQYPGEMTIVLQHQFWGLDVGENEFSVTLTFSDIPEQLTVPYAAVVAFADPSVRFGLQFDVTDGQDIPGKVEPPKSTTPESVIGGANESAPDGATPAAADGSGNVVPLDTFRRK